MHIFSHKFIPIKLSSTCFDQISVNHQEVISANSVHACTEITSWWWTIICSKHV